MNWFRHNKSSLSLLTLSIVLGYCFFVVFVKEGGNFNSPEKLVSGNSDEFNSQRESSKIKLSERKSRAAPSDRSVDPFANFKALHDEIVESTLNRSTIVVDERLEDRRLTIISISKPEEDELARWRNRKDRIAEDLKGDDETKLEELFKDVLGWYGFSQTNFRTVAFRVPFDEDKPVAVSIYDQDREAYKDGVPLGLPKWRFSRGSDEEQWPFQELLKFE